MAALAAVGLLLSGLGFLFTTAREDAEEVTADDVLAELRERGVDSAGEDAGPAPGVYEATGSGHEDVGIGPLDEAFGPAVPVTVTPAEDGCWTQRLDLNSHHSRTWFLCATDEGLVSPGSASTTERVFPGIEFGNQAETTCEPVVVLASLVPVPGEEHRARCLVTASELDATTDQDVVVTVVGTDEVDVGGSAVSTVHVRMEATSSGGQHGTETLELWLADDALAVRVRLEARLTSDSPVGPLDYVAEADVVLDSLEPRT